MQNLPKIVHARLQRAADEIHPDADLLTAFAEQSLGKSERGQVMEHLACCGDCRDVVALALPAIDNAGPASSSNSNVRSGSLIPAWLTWPALRWGVVAAGIVLVTSVGLLQYKERTQQSAALIPGPAQHEEKIIAPLQSPEHDSHVAGQAIVMSPEIAKQIPSRPMGRTDAAHGIRTDALALVQAPSEAPGARSLNTAAPPPSRSVLAAHPVDGPVASEMGMVHAEGAQMADQSEQRLAQNQTQPLLQKQEANSLDVVKAKDSVEPQAGSNVAPAAAIPNLSLQNGLRAFPRWAISSSGALQRSSDAGKTWEEVNVSETALANATRAESTVELKTQYRNKKARNKDQANPVVIFRAVTAVGPEVWAGGSSAMLYRSLDSGSHWTRVVPLEANGALTGDILSIEFLDAQHGTVATSAGEVWLTSDDGRVWHKQQ
ncbi:MAG TPA: YCF48-related protein [Candidatus Sulfotelmatobacter sp.]|jgi:hypothetical protein|nr:YCF48-related protein [Candidatus Sulfotelmatobacter sp.]